MLLERNETHLERNETCLERNDTRLARNETRSGNLHLSGTVFHFSPAGKKASISEIFLCMYLRKQGYHVTNIARKTKVSSYKSWH